MRQFYNNDAIPVYNYFNLYFPKEIIKYNKGEVFVDCGACYGDTALSFIKHCPQYNSIVAFEPDKYNIVYLTKNLKKLKNVSIIQAGVYSYSGEVFFNSGLGINSAINNQQSAINNQYYNYR